MYKNCKKIFLIWNANHQDFCLQTNFYLWRVETKWYPGITTVQWRFRNGNNVVFLGV